MSKGLNQAVSMIAFIAGTFHQLYLHRYFARKDIHNLCFSGYLYCQNMLEAWPMDRQISKDKNEAMAKQIEKIRKWEVHIAGIEDKPPAPMYVFIASRLLADLQEKTNNRYKLRLLSELDEPIKTLEEFVDPEGRHFIAYDRGNELMDKLYEIIEWEW